MKLPRTWQITTALIALLSLAAAGLTARHLKDSPMTTATTTPPMHTLCVGRYLVDVPATFDLEGYDYSVDGVGITWAFKAADQAGFDAVVNARKAELLEQRNQFDKPSLEDPHELTVNGMRVVVLPHDRVNPKYFGLSRAPIPDSDRTLEAWVWSGKHAYKFDGTDLGPGTHEPKLLARIEPFKELAPTEIPQEPGFCMEMFDARALLTTPASGDTYESPEIRFGLKDHPDFKFRLVLEPGQADKPGESLFDRTARASAEMEEEQKGTASRISILRRQVRTVNDMAGQEVVQAFREENGTRGMSLDWEWPGRSADPFAPRIHLEAQTGVGKGGPVQSSTSDVETLRLWDAVLNSIRVRPTVDGKASPATPPKPLGQQAATGRVCEQTGLWECDEPTAIESQRRRFVHAGEPMPHTQVPGAPGLWDRLKGGQVPATRVATVWRLVGYEELPKTTAITAEGEAPGNDDPLSSRELTESSRSQDSAAAPTQRRSHT